MKSLLVHTLSTKMRHIKVALSESFDFQSLTSFTNLVGLLKQLSLLQIALVDLTHAVRLITTQVINLSPREF